MPALLAFALLVFVVTALHGWRLDAHDGIRVTGQAADGLEAVSLSARLNPT